MERLSRTFDYEACLLGLTNIDLDPSGQMNVWMSSAANHQWNPNQPSPATPWEAEIDRLMLAQNSTASPAKRKAYFDKVQEIVWEQAPFLYLVNRNALVAISGAVANARPSMLRPSAFWNVEFLALSPDTARRRL
jgi:peptide/nickel transport system substrate-binding protein